MSQPEANLAIVDRWESGGVYSYGVTDNLEPPLYAVVTFDHEGDQPLIPRITATGDYPQQEYNAIAKSEPEETRVARSGPVQRGKMLLLGILEEKYAGDEELGALQLGGFILSAARARRARAAKKRSR